jgi:hypothetical protein
MSGAEKRDGTLLKRIEEYNYATYRKAGFRAK